MASIDRILSRASTRKPESVAVREWESGRIISYNKLDNNCTTLALYLQAAGFKPGDRIAIYLPNIIEFLISKFAILRAGMVVTYINFRLAIEESVRQLKLANVKLLITTIEKAEAIRSFHEMKYLQMIVVDSDGATYAGTILSSILSSNSSDYIKTEPFQISDALLRFTSGSSGTPKGLIVTHRSWITRALAILAETMRIEEDSMVLCPGPLTHASGLYVLPTFLRTGTLLLMRKFDTAQIGIIANNLPIKYSTFVPTMIKMILDDKSSVVNLRNSKLKQITYGGSPISLSVLEEALDQFKSISFVQSYGSHEAGSIAYLDDIDHKSAELKKSAGKPLLNVELTLNPVKNRDYGELLVNSPWKANAQITFDGRTDILTEWTRTGDLCEIRDGYIFLMDRLNDVIVSGGFNVYPSEVESIISNFPGIDSCAVVGAPDNKWGEKVIAFIAKKNGSEINEKEFMNYCKQTLAGYKIPKEFIWINEIPLNPAGKPDRRALSSTKWKGYERHIH